MSVDGTIKITVDIDDTRTVGLSPSTKVGCHEEVLITFANGTGAGKVEVLWHDKRTLGSGADSLDFTSGLTDGWTSAVDLTKAKGLYVHNTSATKQLAFGYVAANSAPTSAPTATATGGGSTGGTLAAGTYYIVFTETNDLGETTASPESSQLTVSAGNIPRVTFPSLKTGNTARNLYLTAANGSTGTEVLYATGITTSTYDVATAAPVSSVTPPVSNGTGLGNSGTAWQALMAGIMRLPAGAAILVATPDANGWAFDPSTAKTLAFKGTSGEQYRVALVGNKT